MREFKITSENNKERKIVSYYVQEYINSLKLDRRLIGRYYYSKDKAYGYYKTSTNRDSREIEVKKCVTIVNNLYTIAKKHNIEVVSMLCIETKDCISKKKKETKKKEIKETGETGYKIFNRVFNSKMEAIEYCNRNDFLIEFIEEIAM